MSSIIALLSRFSSPAFFRLWFGYGVLIFGAAAILAAWRHGIVAGFLALIVATVFWIESATGFCRRCTHFNCGLHGSVMRRFFRRDPSPLSRARLVLHILLDVVMAIGGTLLIVSVWPALLFPAIVWLSGAAWSALPRSSDALRDSAKWGSGGRVTDRH